MMVLTVASMFTGGGLFDIGAMNAGYQHIWGIEYDKSISDVANSNGLHVIDSDVRGFDYFSLVRPNHLHASPPCPNFSIAKTNGEETRTDIELAKSICKALAIFEPDTFTLENVVGYRHSISFDMICRKLSSLGYWWDATNLNAADFGVPQTRRRLFIRAKKTFLRDYPAPVPWVGWYAAIADLIDELPETQFAPWQLARLPEMYKSFLIGQGSYSRPIKETEPCQTITGNNNQSAIKAFLVGDQQKQFRNGESRTFTITSNSGGIPKVFIINGGNASRDLSILEKNDLIFTVTSNFDRSPARAAIYGKVVKMTVKALGRFQTVPDSYKGLTIKINGNGVPCLMAQRIMETL